MKQKKILKCINSKLVFWVVTPCGFVGRLEENAANILRAEPK
jgi:hypothetical protein